MKAKGTAKTTRLRKAACGQCGYTIRVTRSWMAQGLPSCPCGAGALSPDDPADLIELGIITMDDLPRPMRTEMCKRNGWEDEIVRTNWRQDPNSWRNRKAEDAIPF